MDYYSCDFYESASNWGVIMFFDDWNVHGFDRPMAIKFHRSGINPLPAVFMSSRGVTDVHDAKGLLSDSEDDIFDPFLLKDMDAAKDRIERAISCGERIAVFGDYDVDGMTASCLVKIYLASRGVDADIYIPQRTDEGYGMNRPALKLLAERGINLVITVDCGITSVDEVAYGKSLGLDFVITDHHECHDSIPDASAVVDPKRPDCAYPNRSLAGVGVAFKLICAMEFDKSPFDLLSEYGDLVAIGTVADVMPVTGENRTLIRRGLKRLQESPRPGLTALMAVANAPRTSINTAAIGFSLAPRLNAAGRMGCTQLSIDILLTQDKNEAERLTEELAKLNDRRRELESAIFCEVQSRIGDTSPRDPIVMSGQDWFQGVMGIVAARTSERWMLPSVMIYIDEDGIGRGSCRSYGCFKMYTAIEKCSDLLINFGGHEMAAGITIKQENIPDFRHRLAKEYHEQITSPPRRILRVDFEVEKPELLAIANVEALEGLEPFGHDNPAPCLSITGARIAQLSPVGGGKHSRLRIEKNRTMLDCIFFSASPEGIGIVEGALVDIAFEPQINEFRDRRSVQLHIFDIKPNRRK